MTACSLTTVFRTGLVGVTLFCVIQSHQPAQPCGKSCLCTAEETDRGYAVNVQCYGRNVESVPITSHDKPVSVLKVSFKLPNNTLKEGALLSYESVRYLYLQRCRIDSISEKAFQKLENLTVIDLSNNHLISIHPDLFSRNQLLDRLTLQGNNLGSLQWNTPILNGPPSLSYLDLQSCKLSNISSTTFSKLLNLTFLDISRNKLEFLNPDTLSLQQNLTVVKLEENPWECGAAFNELMCWMHIKLPQSNTGTVLCQNPNKEWVTWSAENQSSLCDSDLTRSVTPPYKPDIPTSTTLNPEMTSSLELDISTSTMLNPEMTSSLELDISTSTTLNPEMTSSLELDISTSTTLNPEMTSSLELDISTSTTLNPEMTSLELDISKSTTLDPEMTSSLELDISTSTTTDSAETSPHELDISTSTTTDSAETSPHELNTPTSTPHKPDIISSPWPSWNPFHVISLLLLLCAIVASLYVCCLGYRYENDMDNGGGEYLNLRNQ